VFAAYKGHADIVYGNILGSNIFNLLGILGIAGLISPLIVQASTVWKEIPLSLLAVVILYLLSNSIFTQNELLSRWDGIILLLVFAFFLYYVFRQLKEENTVSVEEQHKEFTIFKIIVFIVLGLALLVVGGRLVVNNAVKIAEFLGISQTIIGLTIVAVGTSLPELATSVVAAIKKNNDIAVGNIIGSNIFNIFFIMGVSSLIRPIEYNTKFNFEMYFLSFGTILVFIAMFSGKKRRLDRWEAGILLLMYVGYTILLINEQI
jgi:cation:H+ antiporter